MQVREPLALQSIHTGVLSLRPAELEAFLSGWALLSGWTTVCKRNKAASHYTSRLSQPRMPWKAGESPGPLDSPSSGHC